MPHASPLQRLLYHLAGRGLLEPLATAAAFDPLQERPWEVTVSQGRAYAQLPYFRDADLAVPDDVYDVTDQLRLDQHLTGYSWTGATLQIDGQIAWRRVADDVHDTVDVLLRNRDQPETTYVVPARRTGPDTFGAELDTLTLADGSRLPDGIWDVLVRLTRGDVSQTQPCNLGEGPSVPRATFLHWHAEDHWTVASFVTPAERLRLDVGQRKHSVGRALGGWQLSWQDESLVVEGLLDLHLDAPLSLIARRGDDDVVEHELLLSNGRFSGRIPLADLAPGRWAIRVRVGRPPHHQALPVAFTDDLGPHTLPHGIRGRKVRPVAVHGDRLAVDVAASGPVDRVTQAVQRRTSRR